MSGYESFEYEKLNVRVYIRERVSEAKVDFVAMTDPFALYAVGSTDNLAYDAVKELLHVYLKGLDESETKLSVLHRLTAKEKARAEVWSFHCKCTDSTGRQVFSLFDQQAMAARVVQASLPAVIADRDDNPIIDASGESISLPLWMFDGRGRKKRSNAMSEDRRIGPKEEVTDA